MRILGIDEAGRGPVAGPLSVAVVWFTKDVDLDIKPFYYLNGKPYKDSKRITPKRRKEIFEAVKLNRNIHFEHAFVSAKVIDSKGISACLFEAVSQLLEKAQVTKKDKVELDGALRAPEKYIWQSTKKGDEKILEIALASVVAKVLRDEYMAKVDAIYPEYGFAKHKGYGTKDHLQAVIKQGLSQEHRRSFLRKHIKLI